MNSNNVYLTLNQYAVERFADGVSHPQKTFRSTKGIFDSLDKLVGLDSVRVITPREMYAPTDKKVASIYKFNDSGLLEEVSENFETPVLVMIDDNGFIPGFSLAEIERQHDFYNSLVSQGRIGHMMNTVESKETNDKAKLLSLFSDFNPPIQYTDVSPSDVKDLVNLHDRLVIKHRFGSDGKYFFIADKKNYLGILNTIAGSLDEFVYQPALDIKAESRYVFVGDSIVGTRIIKDRRLPGESKENSSKLHQICKYEALEEEVQMTLDAAKIAKMEVGCIDWIYLADGTRHILELNDVGTAMISTTVPGNDLIFDCCDDLANQIVKYL